MRTANAAGALSLILNLVLWLLVLFLFPRDTPAAILHYNSSTGIDFIGQGSQVYILPLIGSLLLAGNFVVGYVLRAASTRAAAILWLATPIIQILLLASFLILWQLNQ